MNLNEDKRGLTRIKNGRVEIHTGFRWTKYPKAASDLISLAVAHGWGVDDGLPEPGERLSAYANGDLYIRVLVGRERGPIPDSVMESPGTQFHVVWTLNITSWELSKMHKKTDQTRPRVWERVRSFRSICEHVTKHRVTEPSVYADAS